MVQTLKVGSGCKKPNRVTSVFVVPLRFARNSGKKAVSTGHFPYPQLWFLWGFLHTFSKILDRTKWLHSCLKEETILLIEKELFSAVIRYNFVCFYETDLLSFDYLPLTFCTTWNDVNFSSTQERIVS